MNSGEQRQSYGTQKESDNRREESNATPNAVTHGSAFFCPFSVWSASSSDAASCLPFSGGVSSAFFNASSGVSGWRERRLPLSGFFSDISRMLTIGGSVLVPNEIPVGYTPFRD